MTKRPEIVRVAAFVIVVFALALVIEQAWLSAATQTVRIDFLPVRHASQDLLDGRSVYSDHRFVYPPTAAVVLLPAALGSTSVAAAAWVVICILMLAAAVVMIARRAAPEQRVWVGALASVVLFGGPLFTDSMIVGNLSILLAPFAAGVVIAFHRDQWARGCALLAATLLVKPLLAPLLLVPAVHRRWRALGAAAVPTAALLAGAVLLVPGGHEFFAVLRFCASGTDLHGANAINNLSVRGWFEAHHHPSTVGLMLSVGVVSASVLRVVALCRGRRLPRPVALANLAFVTTLLASSISEVHFLLTAMAMTLAQVVLEPRWRGRLACVPILLALVALSIGGTAFEGRDRQTWYLVVEIVLYLAAMVTVGLHDAAPGAQVSVRRTKLRERREVVVGGSTSA